MLEIKIEYFFNYCKVSNFAIRSIQSLRVKLNGFNRVIEIFMDDHQHETITGPAVTPIRVDAPRVEVISRFSLPAIGQGLHCHPGFTQNHYW